MALYTAILDQTVEPSDSAIFTETVTPCQCGCVMHQDGTSTFKLRGATSSPCGQWTKYRVRFQGNLAIPEGETVAAVSVGIVSGGEVIPMSVAVQNPAAVEEFWHVNTETEVLVPPVCCSDVSVRNIGTTPIDISNASIEINRL
jgi:hypothetical protein